MIQKTVSEGVALELLRGDHEGWTTVHEDECGTWRWGTEHEIVVRDPAGALWRFGYRTQPEHGVHLPGDVIMTQVEAHEVTTIAYRPVVAERRGGEE
jgi:hypothetical protein